MRTSILRAGLAVALTLGAVVPAHAAGAPPAAGADAVTAYRDFVSDRGGIAPADDAASPHVIAVGDLDGDGGDDVLVTATETTGFQEGLTHISAKRGRDGARLFDTSLDGGVARILPDGDRGFVVLTYDFTTGMGGGVIGPHGRERRSFFSDLAVDFLLRATAFAADGTQRWTQSFGPTSYAYTGTTLAYADGLPVPIGLLDADGNGATDLLVGLYDREPTPDGQVDRFTTTVVGAEGLTAGGMDISTRDGGPVPAGDIDRDGGDDVVMWVASEGDDAPRRSWRRTAGATAASCGAPPTSRSTPTSCRGGCRARCVRP